jgi:hypothetical protein
MLFSWSLAGAFLLSPRQQSSATFSSTTEVDMANELPIAAEDLVQRFVDDATQALALMGSFARGDAGPYSDLDVVRFTADAALVEATTHFIGDRLVVVSSFTPEQVEQWFTEPDAATAAISGLRLMQPLWDPDGVFAAVQARARAFVWDATMQARANALASHQMVGWIEETHKGLEGLRCDDTARLLYAHFGLSWGLSRVMLVQRGILLSGDNAFFDALAHELGPESPWITLQRRAFGIEMAGSAPVPLREQVIAGLHLYIVTAQMLTPALSPADAPLIMQTVDRIQHALGEDEQQD